MLQLVLKGHESRYSVLEVPDLDDGPRWKQMTRTLFGSVDLFVSANDYVQELMRAYYPIAHPVQFIPPDLQVPLDGTMVRNAMARGANWESMVPETIASYIRRNRLDARFRCEFGLETIVQQCAHFERR